MGDEHLVMTCQKDGTLWFAPNDDALFEGTWWLADNRFHFNVLGLRAYFALVREGSVVKLFDASGTLFGVFKALSM